MSDPEAKGRLVLVGTPIGNREDLSPRAARTIAEADLLFCEDTRSPTRLFPPDTKLPPRRSCFVGNEHERRDELLAALEAGQTVVFVSEAGMPVWSDPGRLLVEAARGAGHEVDVVPGPVAATVALAHSGFVAEGARFWGFVPRTGEARKATLRALAEDHGVALIYEAGNRVPSLLRDLGEVFEDGGQRQVVVARELTKKHQETLAGSLKQLAERVTDALRGEVVVVVDAPSPKLDSPSEPSEVRELLEVALDPGLKPRARAKRLAALSGLDAKDIYDRLVALGRGRGGEPEAE